MIVIATGFIHRKALKDAQTQALNDAMHQRYTETEAQLHAPVIAAAMPTPIVITDRKPTKEETAESAIQNQKAQDAVDAANNHYDNLAMTMHGMAIDYQGEGMALGWNGNTPNEATLFVPLRTGYNKGIWTVERETAIAKNCEELFASMYAASGYTGKTMTKAYFELHGDTITAYEK